MRTKCDNCGRCFEARQDLPHVWPDIPGLAERVQPGCTVPSGECPDCGALVYEIPEQGTPGEFRVVWSIDVAADGFTDAAREALRIQRASDSIATVFEVTSKATGNTRLVDLERSGHARRTLACRICGEPVPVQKLREHLCMHNPNADDMDREEIRIQFDVHDGSDPDQEGGDT